MLKAEKCKYGKMLLELFRVLEGRIKGIESRIEAIAYNNSQYLYGGTYGQMEKIIDMIMENDRLKQLSAKLTKACRYVCREYKDIFIASAHPNIVKRENAKKAIREKFKYRIYYFRYFDKMVAALYDAFFDDDWTIEYFFKEFGENGLVTHCLEVAERYYKKRDASQKKSLEKLSGFETTKKVTQKAQEEVQKEILYESQSRKESQRY